MAFRQCFKGSLAFVVLAIALPVCAQTVVRAGTQALPWSSGMSCSVGSGTYVTATPDNLHVFKAINVTPGTSGATQPTWNTATGSVTVDGGCQWQEAGTSGLGGSSGGGSGQVVAPGCAGTPVGYMSSGLIASISGDCYFSTDGQGHVSVKSLTATDTSHAGFINLLNGPTPAAVNLASGVPQYAQANTGASSQWVTSNINQIRYTPLFNWTQSPTSPASLAIGSNTVTLSPCPVGIDTSNTTSTPYGVYVSGTGTSEAVIVTGGTCTPGATSGTIIFAAQYSHGAGYTISSASGGIQEALNDAGTPNSKVVISPVGAIANAVPIYAPVFVHDNKLEVSAYGSMVNCYTRSACFFVGNTADSNAFGQIRIEGLRLESAVNVDGVHVTSVSVTSNVITIGTDNPHNYSMTGNAGHPDIVNVKFYAPGLNFHGLLTLTSIPDSTHFTAAFTHANIAPASVFGWTQLENTGIEDNAMHTVFRDIVLFNTGSNHFHSLFTLDNDQAVEIAGLDTDSGGVRCDANYCGPVIRVRGDAGNAAVVWVHDSNISLQCAGNGIEDFSGNGLRVSDSVIQGYSQYAIEYFGGLQSSEQSNLYEEVGVCTNPYYSGSTQAQVGAMILGQSYQIDSGSQATAPVGNIPQFANTGSNERNYYVVPHSSDLGVGGMFLAGYELTNGSGNTTVQWPCVTWNSATDTVTYDVLLTTDNINALGHAAPYAGSATSLATGITGSPSNGMCSFTDTKASGTAYTYSTGYPQYIVGTWYWPAGVYFGLEFDSQATRGSGIYAYNLTTHYATAFQHDGPSLYVADCSNLSFASPAIASCANVASGYADQTAHIIQRGSGSDNQSGLKGSLIFEGRYDGDAPANPQDLITLLDSNASKTAAASSNRPTWDAMDSAISMDVSTAGNMNQAGIALRAPASLSRYINHTADGTNWLERLTSAGDLWKVPLQTSATTFSTLPTCNGTNEGMFRTISDSTVSSVGSTITGGGSTVVEAYCNGTNWVAGAGGFATIASGTAAMGIGAIASGACATVVTVAATGVATTDVIQATPNTDPTAVTGYAPSASGSLYIQAYPTLNNVNFKVCNNTSGSITPAALTLNWRVAR